MFVSPMLASKMKDDYPSMFLPGRWAAEEKFDGIRLVADIAKGITEPWSRDGIIHPLPVHIIEALSRFPDCIVDGEIYVPGERCYGATRISSSPRMIYQIFDVIRLDAGVTNYGNVNGYDYDSRRDLLTRYLAPLCNDHVRISPSENVDTWERVIELRDEVWARDGEGLILKRRKSFYEIDKRSANWVKIKKKERATMTIIGFEASRGKKQNRGPYAMVTLRGDDGSYAQVKTKNDAECRKFEAEAPKYPAGFMEQPPVHPAIGRRLDIEYQERTPDGAYREARWLRWTP